MNHGDEPIDITSQLRLARQEFTEKLATIPLANSVDGRTFSFQAPISLFLNPGDYVHMTTPDNAVYIGQVLDREVRQYDGPQVNIEDINHKKLDAAGFSIQGASFHIKMTNLHGSGVILSGPTNTDSLGFEGASISSATIDDIAALHDSWAESNPTLTVGSLQATKGQFPARINAAGFNRHTFMCGQSGSGKTYSLGVVLEQILLNTDLRVAVLDPNADYVRLHSATEKRLSAEDGSKESLLVQRYLDRTADLKVFRPTVEEDSNAEALRIRFSDLSREDQANVLMLDPLQDREEFDAFWRVVGKLPDRPFQLSDIHETAANDLSHVTRQLLLRISNLGIRDWNVWAQRDEASLSETLAGDWRSVVLDVSRFERPIERSVIALATLRHFWNLRNDRKPVLLVIDEAHNVCPREPMDSIQAAATELAIAIAGEGRKYGIYLLLSTQRPDKLHPNVVSQCDNLMLMRMNSQSDLQELQQVFSFVPPAILSESIAFRQGEALIAGPLTSSPMLTRFGQRISNEGGADVATTWTRIDT